MTEPPLDRVVFEVDGVSYRWNDVLDAARGWGEWDRLEHRARASLARLRAAESAETAPSESDVEALASDFRYARNLLAADEVDAWLAHWGITIKEWMDHLRAELLPPGASDAQETTTGETSESTWVDAVCSGELARLANRLVERAAVSAASGGGPPVPPLSAAHIDVTEAIFERFCTEAVDEPAIEHEVASHYLGWTRLDWRYLAHAAEDAAREAVLCVREDGMSLEAVAHDAGLLVREASVYLDDADPQIAPALVGAQPGAILGPLRVGDEFWVLEAGDRVTPTTSEPTLRARATRRVVDGAVARAVSARVTWHERL